MAKFKSVIILKNRVYVPDYDDHTYTLKKLGVADSLLNMRKNLIKAELLPKDKDVFSDIDTWTLKIDQDVVPDWYDEKIHKPMVIEAVKRWTKGHIYIGVNNLKIEAGTNYYIKNCKNVEISGNANVSLICGATEVKHIRKHSVVGNICDNSMVNSVYGDAVIESVRDNVVINTVAGNAIIKYVYGNAVIKDVCSNALVKYARQNATIEKARGFSTIIAPPREWNNKDNLVLSEDATFKDCETKKLYQAGIWRYTNLRETNRKTLLMASKPAKEK